MEFRSNIIFSIVAHAMIFTAVLALAGRDAVLRVPERFIAIRLLEEAGGRKLEAGNTRQENRTEKALKKTSRFREVVPPEVPPPPAAQEETPAVAPPEKNRPLQQAAGPAEQGPAEKGKTVSPEQIEGKGLRFPAKRRRTGAWEDGGTGHPQEIPARSLQYEPQSKGQKAIPRLPEKGGLRGPSRRNSRSAQKDTPKISGSCEVPGTKFSTVPRKRPFSVHLHFPA
jgi:hypothetical protein